MLRPLIGGRVWASAGARREPEVAKYQQGWIDEIPTYEVLNYLQYRSDLCLNALAERGVMEWGSDIPYSLGALAWDNADGRIYVALVANPSTSASPMNNRTQWGLSAIQVTTQDLEDADLRFSEHADDTANPHRVTASQAGTLTSAQIYLLVNNLQSAIDTHANNTNNPHGVTAAQAGGVSASLGGRFTGQVGFDAEETLINSASAGSHAIHSSASWTGLRRDTKRLGIRESDGRGFYDTGDGQEHLLLNEEEYLAVRETDEVHFAVPVPDFKMIPLSSIHIPIGFGMSEFTGPGNRGYIDKSGNTQTAPPNEPRHHVTGLRLNGAYYNEQLTIDAYLNLQGFVNVTMFFEIAWTAGASDGMMIWWDNSLRDDKIWIADGHAQLVLNDPLGAQYLFDLGPVGANEEISSFAFTIDGNEVVAYRDGVETERAFMAFAPSDAWDKFYIGQAGGPSGAFDIREIATWATALTPNQVSTL